MYTRYETNRICTTRQTESNPGGNHTIQGEVPHRQYWKTVWEITNGYEPSAILGHKPQALPDFMGIACVFTSTESTQGTDDGDWELWYSGEQ